ncbi:MAG: adenosylcobinamide amidohydrolase, partial [Mycobacteriales bacterium]
MPTSEIARPELLAYGDADGSRRPVLVWRFDPPVRTISTAVLGGGFAQGSWAINAEVALDYGRRDPAEHMAQVAAELGLAPGAGIGLLTAARVGDVAYAEDRDVGCAATVGLLVPTWAAGDEGSDPEWVPGTINLVCHLPAPLSDPALVNAVVTATEAKTQALHELGVPGTGTASDAVVICCP